MKTVIIVDDSPLIRKMIKLSVEKLGHKVIGEYGDGKTSIDNCLRKKPDIITLDNMLPDMFGVEILQKLRESKLLSKIIMISAIKKDSVIKKVKELGANGYLVKPVNSEELISVMSRL